MSKISMDAIEYIRNIPPPFRAIVEDIKKLIFNTLPDVKENFKYNMPV
ncbi:MAG: hypothetical protein ACFFAS_00885 [Promethearchaeota archaeon]